MIELNVTKPPKKFFDEWIEVKRNRHNAGRVPAILEGEAWWCAVGENVGMEINGKNASFSRPVVILRKFNRFTFMGIPLSTKIHEGSWYVPFVFQDRN